MERAELSALVRQTGYADGHEGFCFLKDPHWGASELSQLKQLQTDARDHLKEGRGEQGWLCIPTGGTTGGIRFARHDERTLNAAVRGFCEFFGVKRVNAIDVLPSYHVSGLMARVRCAATGGSHIPCEWRRIEAGERPALDVREDGWVISLVPTQLQRLISAPGGTDWLRGFRIIFIGGGPTWPDLTRVAAEAGLPISLSYGMTETAAMVAAISPQDFLAGERVLATPMPHVQISLNDEGAIRIRGESVFRGYYPQTREARVFETDDLGRIDERGRLQIFGRKDAVIITGGKKVQPMEVEAALQATGQFADVAVLGVPDAKWGERVVSCYPKSESASPNFSIVEAGLETSLASYKRPKRYVAIADWPRNAQGKLNRVELVKEVKALLKRERPEP